MSPATLVPIITLLLITLFTLSKSVSASPVPKETRLQRRDCSGIWDPICAVRDNDDDDDGELIFFSSKCELEEYNMRFPKRKMKIAMRGKCQFD